MFFLNALDASTTGGSGIAQKETHRIIFHQFSFEVKGGRRQHHIILYSVILLFYTSVSVYKCTIGKINSLQIHKIYRCREKKTSASESKKDRNIHVSVCGSIAWIRQIAVGCFEEKVLLYKQSFVHVWTLLILAVYVHQRSHSKLSVSFCW